MADEQPRQQVNAMLSVARGIAAGHLGTHVMYCLEEDRWYIYQNGVWKLTFEIELLSMITQHDTYSWVNGLPLTVRKQILDNLKMLVYKSIKDFNSRGWLNFGLGEFDPVTGTMHDHDRSYLSTIRIPYPYDGSSDCPLWKKTLFEIFDHDLEKIHILQEFFGYCLTRDTRKEKALLLLGESRTGKSTILHVMRSLVGDNNCSSVALKYLNHPQYTPMMMNKLINMDTDVSGKAQEFEAEFKTITSGEAVTCNQKFVETFQFQPYCKIVMAANEFPRITDHSSAFYKRLILIPCDRVFEEFEQDLALKDKLMMELPAIFDWAVEGLKRLNQRGRFEQKDFMKEAVASLREESNPVEIFLKEHVQVVMGAEADKAELFNKYRQWSTENEQFQLSAAKFAQIIYRRYSKTTPKDTKSSMTGKRVWKNIQYVNEIVEEPPAQNQIKWQE